jgi:hypothetical protein
VDEIVTNKEGRKKGKELREKENNKERKVTRRI